MMSEQYLIDLILAKTPYTNVALAEDIGIDLINTPVDVPRIFVGTMGIKLQFPETYFADAYKEAENQELQVTSIQFICKRSDLPTVRSNIKAAYFGESPFPDDSDYSSLAFMEASVIAKTGEKVWFQETIGLVMPRLS